MGNLDDRRVGQVGDPDGGGAATAVVFPNLISAGKGQIGDLFAIGGVGPGRGNRQGQRHRKAPGQVDRIEPRLVIGGGAATGEEHALAVWRPALRLVRRGMVGQALGNSALGGHHIDIDVAFVGGGKGDLRAIR